MIDVDSSPSSAISIDRPSSVTRRCVAVRSRPRTRRRDPRFAPRSATASLFACLRGSAFDGHDHAAQAVADGRGGTAGRPRAGRRRRRAPARRRRHASSRSDRSRRSCTTVRAVAHDRRHHRHQRQDHDRPAHGGDLRGQRLDDRDRRHAARRRARPRRRPNCRHSSRRSVDEGCGGRRARGVVARPGAAPRRRHRVRRRRVHQPRPRPPRSARVDRGVLPGQGPAVRADVRSARRSSTSTTPTVACSPT